MLFPWAGHFIRIAIRVASVDSAVKWVPGGDNHVKDVQCYELFGGIAHKNYAFSLISTIIVLKTDETELMLVTSKRSKHLHNLPTSITIGNAQIPFKQSVKNLGFTLDCHLTMNAHVSNIARTCYFELRRLASIRWFLTSTATATLVSAFVLSRIDYCNSLLFGSTNDVTSHLQRIQNYAARVISCLPMSSSITIHLKSLHWLPVKVRSTYKIACLC